MRRADYDQAVEASGSPSTAASRSSRSGNTGRPGARSTRTIKRRWGWDELMQAASTARRGPKAEARRARRRELLLTLRRAREQLGLAHRRRVGSADQLACLPAQLRAKLRQLASRLSSGGADQTMNFALLVPVAGSLFPWPNFEEGRDE